MASGVSLAPTGAVYVPSMTVSRSDSYFSDAFAKIDHMRRSGSLLCDVTIVFGTGTQIKAHKLILASSSKFFRTLFVDPTLGFSSVVKVQDSSDEVGRMLIDFAYTSQLTLTEYNVIDVLQGAQKLGFDQVELLCVESLRTKFDLNRVQGMDLPSLLDLLNRFAPTEFSKKGDAVTTDHVMYPAVSLPVEGGGGGEESVSLTEVANSKGEAVAITSEHQAVDVAKQPCSASSQQQQQQQPVYVELTPGHIVFMTTTGSIRKIRLSEDRADEPPRTLQLKPGALDDIFHDLADEGDVVLSGEKKPKKKSSRAEKTKKEDGTTTQVSEFERKVGVLTRFEENLVDSSREFIAAWQSEPLKRRRVSCALCSAIVDGTYHDLMEHVWTEHVPTEGGRKADHVCQFCPRRYANRADLVCHVRNVHEGETLDCRHCGRKEFANKRNLRNHETICDRNTTASEQDRKPFCCAECPRTFAHAWGLKSHVNHAHSDHAPSRVACPTCAKTFANKSVLDTHVRTVHFGEKETPRPCPDCGKPYTIRALREHRKRDHQGLRYACPDCATTKLFTTKIMLSRHREVVHQKRRFRCTLCMAEFVDRCAWKLHHEAEHVGKRYPCPQCQKQFKRPGDVRRHIKEVHQQFRYTCQFCEKSFSQQAKLKLHIRSLHMGNYPHICNICGKGFLRPSVLKSHMEKHHHVGVIPEDMILLKPLPSN